MNASSAHSSLASLEHDRPKEWLVEEADTLRTQLQKVNARINTFATISRLPDELIFYIFIWVKAAMPMTMTWIRVTHVCRGWRILASRAPSLWSSFYPRNYGQVLESLERSRDAPLSISWSTGAIAELLFAIVQPAVGRIAHFDFNSHLQRVSQLSEWFASDDSWTQLQTLSLKISNITSRFPYASVPYAIPFNALLQHPPQYLRSLHLDGISPLSWNFHPSMLQNLRTLHLLRLSAPDPFAKVPSMEVLLHLLMSCPLLEDFALIRAGPTLPQRPITYPNVSARMISLRHLRALKIALFHGRDVAFLLAQLEIPETAHVHLHKMYDEGLNGARGVLGCLPWPMAPHPLLKAMSSVQLTCNVSKRMVVKAFHAEHMEETTPCLKMMAKDVLPDQHDAEPVRTALNQLAVIFAASPVTTLSLVGVLIDADRQGWPAVLSSFPCVTTLRIRQQYVLGLQTSDYPALLSLLDALHFQDNVEAMVLPTLSTFEILHVRHDFIRKVDRELWDCLHPRALALEEPSSFKLIMNDSRWNVL